MKISILSIGDEICIGQIVNTNAAWIAEQFTNAGAQIIFHSIIPDNKAFIKSEIYRLWDFSDVVISTGGLGPTHDDITKIALTELFNDKLELSEKALKQVKKFFEKRDKKLTKRNKEQAMLPSKCKIVSNPLGTAPGMRFERKGKLLYALPGVPDEMKAMINETILPALLPNISSDTQKFYKTFNSCGIAEASLADIINAENTFDKSVSVAYLPGIRGTRIRFGIEENDSLKALEIFKKLEKQLYDKAADFIVGVGEKNILHAVTDLLIKQKLTVATAESCTAGLLGAEFTKLPGSSAYYKGGFQVYSNEAKMNLLNVAKDTLDQNGAVSAETAIEMAASIRKKFGSNYGISITGIAGPGGGTDDKPVGTVWIGIANERDTSAHKFNFGSDRLHNRELSVTYSLYLLYRMIKDK